MSNHFTHLHLHTEYSLLDGAIGIDELVQFGVKNNFKSLAISDHGNIFGAVKFFEKAKKAGLKPVLGMEAYFTEDCAIKNQEKKYYHLLLLVENEIGYRNLCKLIAHSYTHGFYFKPRIDYEILKKHSEGLIATSACLGGHIPQLLMNDQAEEARRRTEWFLELFGPERFYLEVQPYDQDEQKKLNSLIFDLGTEMNIPVVATADCHYVHKDDRHAHEVMLAVQTRSKMSDTDRFTFGECLAYMRSADEMLTLFPDRPDVVWNSGIIADRCSFKFETGKLYFPSYPLPAGMTAEEEFRNLCAEGLAALVTSGHINAAESTHYQERLDREIDLILKMGFATYFLVVSDFTRWAKRQHIPVGPGRGSAAGSLVAWALEITDVDPIKYQLLFERFLNPERISMPDIDIDFCIHGRDKVISYVRERYGHDHVCQIITFGTMMAKGVIKDVARALGFPFEDSQAITELISDQLKISLQEAIDLEPRLKQLIETNAKVHELFQIAFRLEGLTRHASKHAAGVVITPQPVTDMLPVYIPPKTDELVTQYAMTELETLGFLKIDFLGLKNLTLIQQVVQQIHDNHGVAVDIRKLPLDDAHTFTLLGRGDTSGVFQLESSGLKEVLRRLEPEKFEDIIAVNALYRPGPLNSGMVDDFIARKHGKAAITYLFPELEPILKETYGVIVYQEQVMHIASTIAGFSSGEADILRRAMGKKKAEEMAKQKQIFVTRATHRNFAEKTAAELFDLMAYFAGYGFNKSHSTAYALIAYQTAYLKAHYPAEFMAALISFETADPDAMSAYIHEAKTMHLPIVPPHINLSAAAFTAHQGKILFGLQGIKNVGLAALEEVIKQRSQRPFASLLDFCLRVDLRCVNKRVVESLIFAGAFDFCPESRAQQHAALSQLMELAAHHKQEIMTGQMSLFSSAEASHAEPPTYSFPAVEPWSPATILAHEKESVGLFLSGHPLDQYAPYIAALTTSNDTVPTEPVIRCGMVIARKTIITKKGDPMAFLSLEHHGGILEVVLFPKLLRAAETLLQSHTIFAVKGIRDEQSSSEKIKAQQLIPLELIALHGEGITELFLELPESCNEMVLAELKTLLTTGSTQATLRFITAKGTASTFRLKHKITLTRELVNFTQTHKFGLRCLC